MKKRKTKKKWKAPKLELLVDKKDLPDTMLAACSGGAPVSPAVGIGGSICFMGAA